MTRRFAKDKGFEVYNGNELIVKGALEAGASLITGYPGSPVADVFDVASSVKNILSQYGILAQLANNEALSVARLNGSQMEDIRAIAVMKSIGLHVAADGLAIGNLSKSGKKGGALIVVGDDPWTDSTQVPADSRFLARHLQIPVMEPASFQEVKDWMKLGFEISCASDLYIVYLITTNQADGGGVVEVFPNIHPKISTHHRVEIDTRKIQTFDTVLLPPRTSRREMDLEDRFRKLHHEARLRKMNQILYPVQGIAEIGLVSSGLAYSYLEHALSEMGLQGRFPVLKLGVTYPVDSHILLDFAAQVKNIIVIEERRSFIEEQITMILKDAAQQGQFKEPVLIWGKTFPEGLSAIPSVRGLNPSLLIEKLGPLFLRRPVSQMENKKIEKELKLIEKVKSFDFKIPVRTPTFCPGCPHRDSSSVLLDIKKSFMDERYMKNTHGLPPVDILFHGDTGCYTMLMFEPNQDLMHNYSGMGLGGGTGAGIDPFVTNKQVVFMGDSTFFHSGMAAISDSVKNHQDITYIILDNKTTAMTGHQPTPGTESDIMGKATFAQDIEKVLRGMTRHSDIPITRVNPAYRHDYRQVLEETILKDGVKVIIADKECGITFHRRVRHEKRNIIKEKGYLPKEEFINITPEVCEYCLECTRSTGCPGLAVEKTDYGPKIVTDLSTCVADTACTKVKVCPSFEKIIVERKAKTVDHLKEMDLSHLPEPPMLKFDNAWRVYVAGVGGMGIQILSSILTHAGKKGGYDVKFCDKKGLAIRNGGVYSEIIFCKEASPVSPLIPNGKADLLWGLDMLEAVRALDPKNHLRVGSAEYTTAFVNSFKTSTIRGLMGLDDFEIGALEKILRAHTKPESYFEFDFSTICEKIIGSKLFVNIVMLGAAYQKGLLPLGSKSLLSAVQEVIRLDFKKNILAFNLGRRIVLHPEEFLKNSRPETFQDMFEEKKKLLQETAWKGEKLSRQYSELVEGSHSQLLLDDASLRHFALSIYDLMRYENRDYAKRYADCVLAVYHKDSMDFQYDATKAVIYYLPKVMLIKDEVYVSYLLTSPEKFKRDTERYQIDFRKGDRIRYRHINRPQFNILGMNIEFDIETRNWQLNIMKYCKFLRWLLPQWHRKEKEFRDWYMGVVDQFHFQDKDSYQLYLQALKVPEEVRGYRHIRYPKMDDARVRVSELLGTAALKDDTIKPHQRVRAGRSASKTF